MPQGQRGSRKAIEHWRGSCSTPLGQNRRIANLGARVRKGRTTDAEPLPEWSRQPKTNRRFTRSSPQRGRHRSGERATLGMRSDRGQSRPRKRSRRPRRHVVPGQRKHHSEPPTYFGIGAGLGILAILVGRRRCASTPEPDGRVRGLSDLPVAVLVCLSDDRQRLFEIRQQVAPVFDAGRDAHQAVGNAGLGQFPLAHAGVRGRLRMARQCVHPAQ